MCWLNSGSPFQSDVFVDPALELVRACPAARALLLVRTGRARAGNASDRTVARVVERVVGDLVDVDVRPDALLVPVREGVDLEHAVALRPFDLRRLHAT